MKLRTRRLLIGTAVLLLAALVGGRLAVDIYTEALWFDGLGYAGVYWRRIASVTAVRVIAALLGAAIVFGNLWWVLRRMGPIHVRRRYGNIEIAEKIPRRLVLGGAAAVAVLAGWWLSDVVFDGRAALDVLFWWNGTDWGVQEPAFGHDVAFYVFSLPVLAHLLNYLLLLAFWTLLLSTIGYVLVGSVRWEGNRITVLETPLLHLSVMAAVMLVLVGGAVWLGRYGLLFQGSGIGGGLGHTDLSARVPARWVVLLLSIAAAVSVVQGARRRSWVLPGFGLGALVLGGLLFTQGVPALVQRFRVEPNELAMEARFIRWNMDATRQAYALDAVVHDTIDYRGSAAPQPSATQIEVLPRWDPTPLQVAFNQTQSFRRFYTFPHVDYDRYQTEEGTRQVAVAVREFSMEGLPETSRTWQTLRLNPQFVRGWGMVVTPAAEVDATGGPVMWLANFEVERAADAPPQLRLEQPSIFFGETMSHYVIVDPGMSQPPERSGEPTARYTGAAGTGYPEGVLLSNPLRLLAFAWRFGDKNLLFSGEVAEQSRFVFRRTVRERVQALAPFLLWDSDAHPVVHDGRVVWLIDGYSATADYPLARALAIEGTGGVRYLRPSVKATVDAITGDVALYVVDADEPMARTYADAFPGLFRPLEAMPANLRRHLRYPPAMLSAQARILTEYHLESPEAFYAGRDVWEISRALGPEGALRPYPPLYVQAALPGAREPEFLLMLPFTARERQNMTAIAVARSDPPHYGEVLLLVLPQDQPVPGPSQVQSLIEQDAGISQNLSLWRQAGTDVDMGRMRVVPTGTGILYTQPLFLSARGNAIPELRQMIASDGNRVTMRRTLSGAVAALAGDAGVEGVRAERVGPALAGGEPAQQAPAGEAPAPAVTPSRALDLLEDAETRLRSGDWSGFGNRLDSLRALLQSWSETPRN